MAGRCERPLIAFFDYPDVFEDFYPHYGVDQLKFATRWANTGSHAFLAVLQQEIGDVVWYAFSLAPKLTEAHHQVLGFRVKFFPSSWLHRRLWRLFWLPHAAWRWRRLYPVYAIVASYVALFSLPFIRALRKDRPDFFFVQSYSSGRFDVLLLISRLLGVPLIVHHAGGKPEFYLGRAAKRWTIPLADRIVVSGRNELRMLATKYNVPREQLRLILTPIDTTRYKPCMRSNACENLGLDPKRRYLLFIGRLVDKIKRVGTIIRVFANLAPEHDDVDLLIAGTGPDEAKLREIAAGTAPGRVRFLGWIEGTEAKCRLYNAADCMVLASQREGFPAVVGEAMACGTPVVATEVGAVNELVVEGKTGWLIPPGDDAALSARLAFVMSNRDGLYEMRVQARLIAKLRVSTSVITQELKECFYTLRRGHG